VTGKLRRASGYFLLGFALAEGADYLWPALQVHGNLRHLAALLLFAGACGMLGQMLRILTERHRGD
jgi:hypothetical protein